MTDPTKLDMDELLNGITPLYILEHRNQTECLEEARRRFAALTERISELEQEGENYAGYGEILEGLTARAEAAERERDEARHKYEAACEAWGYSKARVVVLENALRERPHVIRNDDGLWLHFGDFAAVSVEAICRARGPITGKLIREFCERAALGVRAEEKGGAS